MPEQPDDRSADYDVFYDAPEDETPPAPGPSGGSSAEVLVSALFEAGPEAAEHLLKAAQELLLAAKAVVDAGERVVEQHRTAAEARDDGETDAHDEPRVRRIDLA